MHGHSQVVFSEFTDDPQCCTWSVLRFAQQAVLTVSERWSPGVLTLKKLVTGWYKYKLKVKPCRKLSPYTELLLLSVES